MLNKVQLIGRLGGAPESKFTPDGMQIVNFSLATDESFKGKDGSRTQKTEWHKIVTFGKLAEICANYLVKGKLIYIEGRIQTRSWEDKEGTKRYTTEIVMSNMQMLEKKGDSNGGGSAANTGNNGEGSYDPNLDSDVPF